MSRRALHCAAVGTSLLVLAGCARPPQPVAPAASNDIGLIAAVMHEVAKDYVVPVGPDKLTTGALKGMLDRLDPHSDYLSEHEYQELVATTSGQFGG
ncbi:MAG: hypothetical protein ACREFB_07905, partial [Stellaceae bacterium]